MKEIILHIGHGKTGSSYLQSCLALNRDKLLDIGIDYPVHSSFKEAKRGGISSGNGALFLKNYLNAESLSEQNKILYSSENLFRHRSLSRTFPKILEEEWLSKALEYFGPKIKIIVFTRNLFEISFSIWGQYIKRGGGKHDLNTFLKLTTNSNPYNDLLEWLNLSSKYNCQINLRNYSNHKDNLLNVFLEDLIGKKAKIEDFIQPKNKNVNRSLTFSEYEVQRICNFLNTSKPDLSDLLVNELPDIKSMEIKCSMESYNIVKNANIEVINNINNQIDKNESIKIESPEAVTYKENNIQHTFLTEEQIKIITSYLENNTNKEKSVDKLGIDQIRDIALKIASNQSLDLSNALSLMKIAQSLRPGGAFIKSKVKEWESELN